MDIDKQPIPQFLETQRDTKTPAELQHYFLDFEDFWERKLWHQLTQALTNFFEDPASGPQRLDLYKGFVLTFADKINQLQLVALALNAAEHCKGGPPVHRETFGERDGDGEGQRKGWMMDDG